MSFKVAVKVFLCALFLAASIILVAAAQNSPAVRIPSRITQAIDEANVTTLRGNTHPLAQARFDQGAAPDSMPMQRMLLVLKRSQAQESALDALLDQQQDSTSPNYHHWLTPEQFGQQFGPSDQDIQTITNWLQSRGFSVAGVSNGRTVIEFSGTAGQVRQAFRTEIHRYAVNGQNHWANSADPQIPAALAPVVAGINTLYNFPRRAMHQVVGSFSRSPSTGQIEPVSPQFTINWLGNEWLAVAPADFAKIYNVPNLSLVPAPATQYNGDGQTIAIVGESDINLQDVNAFRTMFGLPVPAKLNTIVSGADPGTDPGGLETEADLDVEWAGAVAPNATIDLVLAQDTETSLGVDLAAQYAVDNNIAPVLNESFGICEFFMGNADNTFYSQLWQQAAAEGITVTVSSGDGGSAACDQNVGTQGGAQFGLSVSGFTSTPYNISVGGTDFNDVTDFNAFWNVTPTNTPTLPSVLGYVPEMTWNDSCTNQEIFQHFSVTSAEQSCNNTTEKNDGYVSIGGGSGGKSQCIQSDGLNESSCSQGYPKPSWQAGPGVPADGVRDIPDVSLFASNGFNASFYAICEADLNPSATSCDPFSGTSTFVGIGGTSASSPAFAGIMALVNQATGERHGNANYILYKLASQSGNTCMSIASSSSTCVFYDVPSGSTIAMPCTKGAPDDPTQPGTPCSVEFSNDTVGILSGYDSGTGYDLATGLGSINAANLIGRWKTFESSLTPSSTTLALTAVTDLGSLTHGESVQATVTVTGSGGTPSGTVSLIAQTGASAQQSVASAPLVNGTATFSTTSLPGGSNYNVVAQYSGDATFKPSTSSPQAVSVTPEASKVSIEYLTFDKTTGKLIPTTTAPFDSPALLRINVTSQAGDACVQKDGDPTATSGCPTGTVTVTDNGAPLDAGTYTLNSQGYAEDQSIFLTGGTHSIVGTYAGDNSYTASSCSCSTTVAITPAPTTTALSTPYPYPPLGTPFSITATIAAQISPSSAYRLTGSPGDVQFFSGSTPITPGSGTTVTYQSVSAFNGDTELLATLNTSSLPLGAQNITAQYNGSQNYAASAISNPYQISVTMPTATTLSSSNTSPVAGEPVSFTATVAPTQPGAPAPTGAVGFTSSGVGADGILSGDLAQASLILPAGTVQVVANYRGDSNNAPSTSPPVTETVTPISTSMTFSTSNPAPQVGDPVVFTASIASAPDTGPATFGYVNLSVNGGLLASGTVLNGQATITTAALPAGTEAIVATYVPDRYRSGSTASVTETVSKATPQVAVNSGTPTVIAGTPVTFVASISYPPGAPFPTGTVQFTANGTPIGAPLTLSYPYNWVNVTTSSLPIGAVSILASYSGDSNYVSVTSQFTQTVTVAPTFSISANPTSLTIATPGQSASTTLTFTSQYGLAGPGYMSSSTCGIQITERISCTLSAFSLGANGTAQATLTFQSTAASQIAPDSRDRSPFQPGGDAQRIFLEAMFCAIAALALIQRRKQRRWQIIFGAVLVAVVLTGVSCGGGSTSNGAPGGFGGNTGTPVGPVQMTVSITIDGVTQTVPNLTLTVQ